MPSSALFGRGAILRRRKSRRRLLLASGISLFVLMIALPAMGETMTLPDGTMNNDHIEIDGHDLTVQVDGTAELSGILYGPGGVIKSGPGTLILSGSNEYTDATIITAGTVVARSPNALGFGLVEIGPNGTLAYEDTVDNHIITDGGTLYTWGWGAQAGDITGKSATSGLTITGSGSLSLSGKASYGGQTDLLGGLLIAEERNVLSEHSLHHIGSAILQLNKAQTIGGLAGTGDVNLRSYALAIEQAQDTVFSGHFVGDTDASVTKRGDGALVLSGDSSAFLGGIRAEGGITQINANYQSAAVAVSDSATLRGRGQAGYVEIYDGGVLEGWAGQTFSLRQLVLNSDSYLDLHLGAPLADPLFSVEGDLTLDGNIRVLGDADTVAGVYRIASFGGVLLDQGAAITANNTGLHAELQTSLDMQVNVILSEKNQHLLFWNGSVTEADGNIHGGSGLWTSDHTHTNWLDQAGDNASAWTDDAYAVFQNNPGHVSVDDGGDPPATAGMQFIGSGWVINQGAISLTGPGLVDIRVGDGTGDANTHSAEIGSALIGSGGMAKRDLGTLILSGINTYAGETLVAAGVLDVRGSITSDTTVLAGARLTGSGTVGSADVSGSFGARDFDTLTVDGDLALLSNSSLEVFTDADGRSGRVDVTGKVTISDSMVRVRAGAHDYGGQRDYLILSAQDSINGEFAGVTTDLAFLTPSLSHDGTAVYLHLARNERGFGSVAHTPNQMASGDRIMSLGGGVVHDAMLGLSEIQGRYALDQLSGEMHASIQGSLMESSGVLRGTMNERLLKDESGVWVSAHGARGELAGTDNAAEVSHSSGGILGGVDGYLSSSFQLGVTMGYTQSALTIAERGSEAATSSTHVGLYGGTEIGDLAFRSGLAYSWSGTETSRSVTFPGLSETLTASYSLGTVQGFAEISYGFDLGTTRFAPYANVAHVAVGASQFQEQGGAAALKSGGDVNSASFATLGLRGDTAFSIGETEVSASGALGWRQKVGGSAPAATLGYVAGGGSETINGGSLDDSALVVQAGLDLQLAPTATFGASYDGLVAAGATHTFKANLSVAF